MSFRNEASVNECSIILVGASTELEEAKCVVFLFQSLSMCLDCVTYGGCNHNCGSCLVRRTDVITSGICQ